MHGTSQLFLGLLAKRPRADLYQFLYVLRQHGEIFDQLLDRDFFARQILKKNFHSNLSPAARNPLPYMYIMAIALIGCFCKNNGGKAPVSNLAVNRRPPRLRLHLKCQAASRQPRSW